MDTVKPGPARPTRPRSPGRASIRQRARWIVVALLLVGTVLILATGLVVAVAVDLRGSLEEGRVALESGRSALLDGRVSDASDAFGRARARFDEARDGGSSGFAAVARSIPVLGRTIHVFAAVADAGGRLAEAGSIITTSIGGLPGGVEGLAPSGGAIPLDRLRSLGEALGTAHANVASGSAALRSSPSGLLPWPVADARARAIERVAGLERLFRSARAFAVGLPAFAGADGPRRYLFFAEDPAELRGTGGLWGAYATVRARAGRFDFSRFRPVQSLGDLDPEDVPAPNADYERNYRQYGAPGYWLNTNMTPDLPSAAEAALATWRATGREPLDGVITADPFALRSLLAITGSVRLPSGGIRLTPHNVIAFLANRAFARFPDPRRRKAILGDAAGAVVARFLDMEGHAIPRFRAIADAIASGHLKLYSTDASMAAALAEAGVDGGLRADGGDLLGVIVNSASGGKVEYFSARTIEHEVTLLDGGATTATTRVRIENDAPVSGQPRYVIGPFVGKAGDDIPLLAVFCGRRCGLVRAEREGDPLSLRTGTELGYRFYRDYFTVPSGQERTLTVTTETPAGWTGDWSRGSYRLTVIGQTTIRPTHIELRFDAPVGMRFTEGSDGVSMEYDRATWRGVLGSRLQIRLSFEREPLLVRLWHAIAGNA